MNFSEVFIRRPIATSLLMFGIALFGVVSYRALPGADLPNVDFPTLSVTASLPECREESRHGTYECVRHIVHRYSLCEYNVCEASWRTHSCVPRRDSSRRPVGVRKIQAMEVSP